MEIPQKGMCINAIPRFRK